MLKLFNALIRFCTALVPVKSVRKRIRRRLLELSRAKWIKKTVPVVRARYADHVRRCREKLAHGEKLRVCFLVCDAAMFSAESVYVAMCKDGRFAPYIAVAPRVSRGDAFLRETLQTTVETLEARYGRVDRLYDPDARRWGAIEGKADLVVTSVVYGEQTDARFTAEPMSRYALVACISYGYSGQLLHDEKTMIFLPQFALFWRLFITNPATRDAWAAANPLLDYNLVVGGYAKMDRLASVRPNLNRPKTIILSPHHSLERGADGVALSNFLAYADFLLELPTLFPDVRFVFRPHPLLFPRLAMNKWWGSEKTEDYRKKMASLPNVEFQQGGDYFEAFVNSDAMIHDCGSFQAEYFYMGNPQCFVLADDAALERELTPFGRRLHQHIFHAKSREDIVEFVRRVVLSGVDPDAEARRQFAKDEVCLYHPNASGRVLSALVESLHGGGACVKMIDAMSLFRRSRRFDLAFKIELARRWRDGDAAAIREAEEAYLEMVRARNGFYERDPHRTTPDDFLGGFRRLATSIRERGYDLSAGPIPVDAAGELLNGAHRLAACAAYGVACPVAVDPFRRAGGSVESVFRRGGIANAVADWGIRAYLKLAPDGCLAAGFGALSDHPAAPFPIWRQRAEMNGGRSQWRGRLAVLKYCFLAKIRRGKKKAKALAHAEERACRIRAHEALAAYWEKVDK